MERLRRTRRTARLREMVRENDLRVDDLVCPVFVVDGPSGDVESMPGVRRHSLEDFAAEIEKIADRGIPAVLIFGVPAAKDETGSGAAGDDAIVPRAIRIAKARRPDLVVVADVCLCEYTSHGHCGVVKGGEISNDETLPLIAAAAVSYAKAGADFVAPSGMMDGAVAAIRAALDSAGFPDVAIMAYSAKYASAFYGPFRDAAKSAPAFGDRRTYQMDPANSMEALREAKADAAEGADAIIAKPAMAYLDVLSAISRETLLPVVAYSVSGEYAMVKAAAEKGWIDEKRVVMESLLCMKRAGARMIITYHAMDAAGWMRGER